MAKVSELPQVTTTDGSEEILVVRGPANARETRRMPAGLLGSAANKPTPNELRAAILAALVQGENITFVDNPDGTVGVKVASSAELKGVPKAPTAAPGTNSAQLATTAFVKAAVDLIANALSNKQDTLVEGPGVDLVDNGDGTFTISSTGGGAGLVDGDFGGIVVSGGGTVITVKNVPATATVRVPNVAFSADWSGSAEPPTKGALFAKFGSMDSAIASRVASTAVGAPNGVAGLDAAGRVPANQLPSYVDDVLEYASAGNFPMPGEGGKIYVAADTGRQSRWTGNSYVELTASPGTTDNVPEGNVNRYYTEVRVRATIATGLADVAGSPAANDSLLAVLGKLRRQAFTALPADVANRLSLTAGGTVTGYALFASGGNIVSSGATARCIAYSDSDNDGALFAMQRNNRQLVFMGIDADNVFRIGGGSWGAGRLALDGAGNGQFVGNLLVNGGVTAANFTYTSDRRLKSGIRALEGEGAAVLALAPVRYVKDGRAQIGFIAQDVEAVCPEAVHTADDKRGTKSLDLGPLVAELVARVQYLDAEVARLKAAA